MYYPSNLKKKIKRYFYRIISTKGSEHSIALGFAIGSFIAIIPSFGLDILIGLLLALIFKRINKISLFGSFIVWNPITLLPIYLLSYQLGGLILGSAPIIRYNVVIADQIYNFSRRFLVGIFILATIISITFYFIIRIVIKVHKRRILKYLKETKKIKKKH